MTIVFFTYPGYHRARPACRLVQVPSTQSVLTPTRPAASLTRPFKESIESKIVYSRNNSEEVTENTSRLYGISPKDYLSECEKEFINLLKTTDFLKNKFWLIMVLMSEGKYLKQD